MLLAWCLILSITLVSVTMLMMVGAFLAILPQAEEFYGTNQSMVLLLSNAFNICYILISPLLFDSFNRHYLRYVAFSTAVSGIAAIGRYLAGQNYEMALAMTCLIAVAHIPIITAPYGLLKLFPDHHKGYAASIPLFLPVLGINFCILYGMAYITKGEGEALPVDQVNAKINDLNFIIAAVGLVSSILTIFLLYKLKDRINETDESSNKIEANSEQGFVDKVVTFSREHSLTIVTLICWGTIVGINWTYGSLFRVIFEGQGLSDKEIAILGLTANLSTAFFSNLGTFIKNRWNISNTKVIGILNITGFIAAILLEASKSILLLQNIYLMIALIIILRAGFSSFVSLAFVEMGASGIPSVIVSGMFFWVANVINLATTELVDLVDVELSISIITLTVALCIHFVSESYIKNSIKS
jgi:hypothetical protein